MNESEEMLAFYFTLGKAVSAWSTVEFRLGLLATTCFPWRVNVNVMIDSYYAIENFRSKLAYVDRLLTHDHSDRPSVLAYWAKLSDRIKRGSTKRNKLVHSQITINQQAQSGHKIGLTKWSVNSADKPQPIFVRDIAGFLQEFHALSASLSDLHGYLRRRWHDSPLSHKQLPKPQEPPAHPPTIAQLRKEIYAYASRQLRPSEP